jgi:curli biogenesis system outer membrane secretion channel CsgG
MDIRMSQCSTLLATIFVLGLGACAPTVVDTTPTEDLRAFQVDELPFDQRYIIAVPNFQVRTGSVKVGRANLAEEGQEFLVDLGSGVADIFVSEAFRSGRFRITERAELDTVLLEQNLARAGRIDTSPVASTGPIGEKVS